MSAHAQYLLAYFKSVQKQREQTELDPTHRAKLVAVTTTQKNWPRGRRVRTPFGMAELANALEDGKGGVKVVCYVDLARAIQTLEKWLRE